MEKTAVTGNHGEKIRSDCQVKLQRTEQGGRNIEIRSKVKTLYGDSIKRLVKEMLDFYEIEHVNLEIDDSGALDHVLAARIEAGLRRVSNTKKEFLLPPKNEPLVESSPDRFRLSRLYIPGNNPSMMINAGIHHPDGIILDLEDSVAPSKKDEACILVRNALRAIDFYGSERMVRINQLPLGLEDLRTIVPQHPDIILIPKCEHAWQVEQVSDLLSELRQHDREIFMMPIIESALGVENAFNIATAADDVVAIAIGLEDYAADLGVERTEGALESYYARTRIVNACKAAGIQPIDSVYSDVSNETGLRATVAESKSLGFEGMGCIHPAQIRIIHEAYMPSAYEIEKAERIIQAYNEAKERGLGVVALGSKMIDAPVVKRAEQTLVLASKTKQYKVQTVE